MKIEDEIIQSFHLMWDAFPGPVRLIDKTHTILAANEKARSMGFIEGVKCTRVGAPEVHRGCRAAEMLRLKTAQVDRSAEGKVRGWVPVVGHEDILVHFALVLPEKTLP